MRAGVKYNTWKSLQDPLVKNSQQERCVCHTTQLGVSQGTMLRRKCKKTRQNVRRFQREVFQFLNNEPDEVEQYASNGSVSFQCG